MKLMGCKLQTQLLSNNHDNHECSELRMSGYVHTDARRKDDEGDVLTEI